MARQTLRTLSRVLVGALILTALVSTGLARAAGPFEPNNALTEAAVPLMAGETHTAGIEAAGDRDFFYFYVTSAPSARIELTIRNLGGVGAASLSASIVDGLGTTVGASSNFISFGGEASTSIDLAPQKYFLVIEPVWGDTGTTTYSLVTGGGNGAFGPFAQIEGRCSSARTNVTAEKRRLQRAQAKLQRASSRLRRSLFGTASEHRDAASNYRHAKARTKDRLDALRTAAQAQAPWCQISP